MPRGHPAGGAEGDHRLRVVLNRGSHAQPTPDRLRDQRDTARPTHQEDAGQRIRCDVSVAERDLERGDRVVDHPSDQSFQLGSRQLYFATDARHPQLADRGLAERLLGPLDLQAERRGVAPPVDVGRVPQRLPGLGILIAEDGAEVGDDVVVDVLPAEGVASSRRAGDHEPRLGAEEHRGVERAAPEVVDGDPLTRRGGGQRDPCRRGHWFGEERDLCQPGLLHRLLQDGEPRVPPIRGVGDR